MLDRLTAHAYNVGMGILNIRNLPDDVHGALRQRAALNGTSMEAEARAILTAAVRPQATLSPEQLQNMVDNLCRPDRPSHVVDDFLRERRREAQSEP
jgi:plasmid stability protein